MTAAGTIDLTVDLGRGLVLPNPILVASGTFGYGVEYGDVVDVDRLGGICCKGTTLKARILASRHDAFKQGFSIANFNML